MSVTSHIEIPEINIQSLQAQLTQHGLSLDDFVKIVRAAATDESVVTLSNAQERVRKLIF